MSKKKWCGLLAILMAVSIVFTSGALRPVNVYAETIADLQEQSEEHQKKLEEINQQIEEAEANKADALEQKNLLDQQADVLRSQISNAQQQIDALEAELADNQQKEESQYDLFCRQVRDEEERGTASFWSVIFKATSFSDLLGRIDFINEVAEHDQSVINDLRQLRQQMPGRPAGAGGAALPAGEPPDGAEQPAGGSHPAHCQVQRNGGRPERSGPLRRRQPPMNWTLRSRPGERRKTGTTAAITVEAAAVAAAAAPTRRPPPTGTSGPRTAGSSPPATVGVTSPPPAPAPTIWAWTSAPPTAATSMP